MIRTKMSWDNLRLHFSYMWWAYAVMAAVLIFVWSMWYHTTEYEPPADKKLQFTIVGDYVSQSVLDFYKEKAQEEFPELEKITVDNITLDFTGEGDYSGYQKLQVVIAVGEGDVYLMNDELMHIYGDMAAFAPLDDLVAEGGPLYGMFTEEELARGTFLATDSEDGLPHLYALPTDRLYGLLEQGVDTFGKYVMVTSYSGNPEYARKALIWLCEQTNEEPPAWIEDLRGLEDETVKNDAVLPEIG